MDAFSVEYLNKIPKACGSGKFPPPMCPEPFPLEPEITNSMSAEEVSEAWDVYGSENVKFNRMLIDVFENACTSMVFTSSEEYRSDVATAVKAVKAEFMHHSSLEDSEWWIVYETLSCCMEDISRRLDLQCRHTTSTQTTDYEKQNGGTIRFLPSFSCETVVRNVYLPLERATRSIGRSAIKKQFPIGAAADHQLRERKAARQKSAADAKKKAEQSAKKKADNAAEKAAKAKEADKKEKEKKKKQQDNRKAKDAAKAAKAAEDDATSKKAAAADKARAKGKAAAEEAKKVRIAEDARGRGRGRDA